MPNNSEENVSRAKSSGTGKNTKAALTAIPSLPKEEPKKELKAPAETARDELKVLQRVLEEERLRSREYLDRMKYLQADFENSVRRLRREAEEAVKLGNEQLIFRILDVAENLERAVEAGEKIGEKSELTTGVKMISKQLNDVLRQEGLERIPVEGEKFDPALHEALAQTETEEKAEGTIIKEIKRGYMFKGKILRPSKVEVAKKPSPREQV